MNAKAEALRQLEEFDHLMHDVESDDYQAVGFEGMKPSEEFIRRVERHREKLLRKVDKHVLHQYERIRKRYGTKVVVQVMDDFCTGCYIKLPSELAVRCRNELINCPNCGRFLYYYR